MSLFFPRPSGSGQVSISNSARSASDSLPSVAEEGSTTLTRRQPPRNFAEARSLAREIRAPKTPFVQARASAQRSGGPTGRGPGKERDLSGCDLDQIKDIIAKNDKLLSSPQILASLPDQGNKIREYQLRLEAKLQELQALARIRRDLANTHIDDDVKPVKREEGEQGMDTAPEGETSISSASGAADDFGHSPQRETRQRLTERIQAQQPHSLVSSMSFAESLELQRQAARREQERRAAMDLALQRPTATGHLLKNALAKDSALDDFMFHADSDEEEEEEDDFGGVNANALDEEEEAQLNPLRTAYQEGWERAANEAKEEAGRIVKHEDEEMSI